jgi:hypothetical protein
MPEPEHCNGVEMSKSWEQEKYLNVWYRHEIHDKLISCQRKLRKIAINLLVESEGSVPLMRISATVKNFLSAIWNTRL